MSVCITFFSKDDGSDAASGADEGRSLAAARRAFLLE